MKTTRLQPPFSLQSFGLWAGRGVGVGVCCCKDTLSSAVGRKGPGPEHQAAVLSTI